MQHNEEMGVVVRFMASCSFRSTGRVPDGPISCRAAGGGHQGADFSMCPLYDARFALRLISTQWHHGEGPPLGGIVHSGTDVWRVSVIWVQNCAGALNTVITGLPCCKQGLHVCTGMALRPAWSQLSVMCGRKGQKCT